MAALQTLRLNDNRFTQLISAMVVGLGATLEGLYLSTNAVASVDEDLDTQLGALATLDLNSNKLTAIPDGALPDMGELHRLDLSHNRIAAVTMAMIAAGPQTKLTYLELHHNPVAKVDTAALAMLGGSAGHMNALGNWPAGDEDGSLHCTLDKGVFDAAVGIQISKCKCPGGGNPVFCGGSTTIALRRILRPDQR